MVKIKKGDDEGSLPFMYGGMVYFNNFSGTVYV